MTKYVYPPAFDILYRTYDADSDLGRYKIKQLTKKLLDGYKVSIMLNDKRVLISLNNGAINIEDI